MLQNGFSNLAMTLLALFTAPMVGTLSDAFSRKLAMLIPFAGVVVEDFLLIAQARYMREASVYWITASEGHS